MTDGFRETLQTTLGTANTIERELGGGGMSRVFVADDVSLGRKIVVKIIAGVVHRDIKPENVLVSGGAAVITDFGIAKALSASRTQAEAGSNSTGAILTRAGMSLGTPAYMSPEQALGDPNTDHRADLYAWGVVAWEMFAGAHPFAGRATTQAMVAAHVTDVPPPIATRRPDVPASLASVIARCLEKARSGVRHLRRK